jgi:hypothetical protein
VAKQAPLVTQYLERISRDAVEKHQKLFRQYVRHRQGVYALYKDRKLYYVGLAVDLRWRLKQHLRDHHRRSWNRFSVYLTIQERHLKELETLLLRITGKPPGNRVLGKFRDSENLKRRLKRDLRRFHDNEVREFFGQSEDLEDHELRKRKRGKRASILVDLVRGPMKLRATLRGKLFKARVRRNGTIRFKGETFTSPSAAASAICGHPSDGWYFWKYERGPGDWVKLHELRR